MIKVLGKKVLVEEIKNVNEEIGGIMLPQSANQSARECKVIEVGDGLDEVKLGDIIMISKSAGVDVKYANYEWLIVEENDIIAIIG